MNNLNHPIHPLEAYTKRIALLKSTHPAATAAGLLDVPHLPTAVFADLLHHFVQVIGLQKYGQTIISEKGTGTLRDLPGLPESPQSPSPPPPPLHPHPAAGEVHAPAADLPSAQGTPPVAPQTTSENHLPCSDDAARPTSSKTVSNPSHP